MTKIDVPHLTEFHKDGPLRPSGRQTIFLVRRAGPESRLGLSAPGPSAQRPVCSVAVARQTKFAALVGSPAPLYCASSG